jgi:6-phosphogluconolactonase (cycloisomerase 2 family)
MLITRRTFTATAAAAPLAKAGEAHTAGLDIPFYSSTGPLLTLYGLNVAAATATRRGKIELPANVQYAWPHPSRQTIYVMASNVQPAGGPRLPVGPDKNHYAFAYRVAEDGALSPLGPPRLLDARPIHVSVDRSGSFLLIAYNNPSHVSVYRLDAGGTIGAAVQQPAGLDFGIFAHQVRAMPSNRAVALVTRGNDATSSRPEDPGAIKVFGFKDGVLSNRQSVAPGNGIGFGPRHLDFHPRLPRAYVSLERENALFVYGLTDDGALTPDPLWQRSTLLPGAAVPPGQMAGAIHLHPGGRFVYQANRGSGTVMVRGREVWNGGENSILVWLLNQKTGEPRLIQRMDSRGFEPRTFAIDPSGRLLVAANIVPLEVARQDSFTSVQACFSLFRIGDDGHLIFVRKYDVDTSRGTQFWCGLLTMA